MGAVMIIPDGMQDIAYDALGGKTPYDAGKGDNMRMIEEASQTGRLITTPPGFEADTQTCILTMLGLEPHEIPPGRSYIEALALGLEVGADDIIMRCNFVEVDDKGKLAVPCCSAPEDVAKALRGILSEMDDVTITPVGSYKSLQMIRGGAKYLDGLVTSMPHQNQNGVFEKLLPRGNKLAERLADFSCEMLKIYRPYTVLNWGQAVKGELPAFSSLYTGKSGAIISKTDAPIGIAAAMGMQCPAIPTATGDTDTDLPAKAAKALELAAQHDFVMVHIGGPDEATHRQNPIEKADFIRKMDTELIGPILRGLRGGDKVMLVSDHAALCETAGHTDEPVKFWLYEKGAALSGDMGTLAGKMAVRLLI
ncbi:MAG: hypothetical protein FWH02_02880 [Oscillospiraceae bacterium]|nr:hypothetical protein [Oscillospiraceae bacterium]